MKDNYKIWNRSYSEQKGFSFIETSSSFESFLLSDLDFLEKILAKPDFFVFFIVFVRLSRVGDVDSVLTGLNDRSFVDSDGILSTGGLVDGIGLPNRSTFEVNANDVWTGTGVCGRNSYQLSDVLLSNGRFDDINGTDSTNGDISPTVI